MADGAAVQPLLLDILQPLPEYNYVTAFGPGSRCLFGSQNGYEAADLPLDILNHVASGTAKKILFASFGSDPHEWFVGYEDYNGNANYQHGPEVSPAVLRLHSQIEYSGTNAASFLRVQYGAAGSYVAWTETVWISRGVPETLSRCLMGISHHQREHNSSGTFRAGHPHTITWHSDGSFVVIGRERSTHPSDLGPPFHFWHFAADAINNGWKDLWGIHGSDEPGQTQLSHLVHAAINPHRQACDTYVLIKKQTEEDEIEYVVRFAPAEPVSRLKPPVDAMGPSKFPEASARWAHAIRAGRPHKTDTWELYLKKDEKVKIIEDRGNGWLLVQNKSGLVGYAARAWLDFEKTKQVDLREAYARFQRDSERLFQGEGITSFIDLSYMDTCPEISCNLIKGSVDGIGICEHDLEKVLKESVCYSRAFLKEERNKWHPDRFTRFCHGQQRAELVKKAERLFVMIGVLIDKLEKRGRRD